MSWLLLVMRLVDTSKSKAKVLGVARVGARAREEHFRNATKKVGLKCGHHFRDAAKLIQLKRARHGGTKKPPQLKGGFDFAS